MNLSLCVRLWVFLCVAAVIPSAASQESSSPPAAPPPSAHVSRLDGSASLERDGQGEVAHAGMPLMLGDRLRTASGRAEILFTDGSALHLDEDTTADILAADLVRLLSGRIYLYVAGARDPSRAVPYQFDAPAGSVRTSGPGQYRVTATDQQIDLAVVSGEATLATDRGAVSVRAGEQASAQAGYAPGAPAYFNSARWDPFDRWSATCRDERAGTVSTQYLPAELSAYSGTFDRYGVWRSEPSVGYVWYPTVDDDWRPYYYGYWRPYPSWGPVWVGLDPWGWPTHHYGRWGFSVSFGWYWAPARIWSPAWVYWGSAPGYVSWCALGWHGGPVFGMWGARGGYYGYGRHVDPWRGWTVIPGHGFGHHTAVPRLAVNGRHLPLGSAARFNAHRTAPPLGTAVPRSWAHAGTGPSPRSGSRPGSGLGTGAGPGTGGAAPRGGGARASLGSAGAGAARATPGSAVPRYGRGDGTGLSRPVGAPASPNAGGARAWPRASGAGTTGSPDAVRGRPTSSQAIGDLPRSYRVPPAGGRRAPDATGLPGRVPGDDRAGRTTDRPGGGAAPGTYRTPPAGVWRAPDRASPRSPSGGDRPPTASPDPRSYRPSPPDGSRTRGGDGGWSAGTPPPRSSGSSGPPAYRSAPPRSGGSSGTPAYRSSPPPRDGGGSRYNPGAARPRDGGSSGASSRRRPPGKP